jgi:hypothetical protein
MTTKGGEEENSVAALDNELTALLQVWNLEDAAGALTKHGWKSVSRLKLKNHQHMDELGLPSGTASAREGRWPFGYFSRTF